MAQGSTRGVLEGEAGYSLVEVMVSIMLLCIAIIPMVGMFDAGLRAAVLGSNHDKARALANEKLEEIKALPYSNPDPDANSVIEKYPPGTTNCVGAIEPGFSCEVQTTYARVNGTAVVSDPDVRTMMQVTVRVTRDGGTPYTLTSLVVKGQ